MLWTDDPRAIDCTIAWFIRCQHFIMKNLFPIICCCFVRPSIVPTSCTVRCLEGFPRDRRLHNLFAAASRCARHCCANSAVMKTVVHNVIVFNRQRRAELDNGRSDCSMAKARHNGRHLTCAERAGQRAPPTEQSESSAKRTLVPVPMFKILPHHYPQDRLKKENNRDCRVPVTV